MGEEFTNHHQPLTQTQLNHLQDHQLGIPLSQGSGRITIPSLASPIRRHRGAPRISFRRPPWPPWPNRWRPLRAPRVIRWFCRVPWAESLVSRLQLEMNPCESIVIDECYTCWFIYGFMVLWVTINKSPAILYVKLCYINCYWQNWYWPVNDVIDML